MNLRIRKVRKMLDLTQKEFAERLGIKQNSIALIESGKRNTSNQVVLSICREFNVDEKWLRTGIGNMFNTKIEDDISEIVDKYNLSVYGEQIIRTYIEMNAKQRSVIDDFVKNLITNCSVDSAIEDRNKSYSELYEDIPDTPEEFERQFPPVSIDDDNNNEVG